MHIVGMDCEKMMTLLASLVLLLVVMDTVTSYPAAGSESHQPSILMAKKDRRPRRQRSPASRPSASAAELIPDVETVALDVASNPPSSKRVKSAEGHSSGVLSRRKRHRRSVAWHLQAVMRMCEESRANGGGRGCKELSVNNGRLRIQVRMQEE